MATQTTFVYGSTSSVRICGDVDSCSLDVLLDADCDDVCGDEDNCAHGAANDVDGDDVEIDVRALRTNGDGESAPSPGFANNDLVRADEPLCLFAASTSTTNDLAVRVTCCLRHRHRVRPCVWRRRPDLRARWA